MILATCDCGHTFNWPKDRVDEPGANCPTCGALTFNPTNPKRKKSLAPKDYFSKPMTDSDSWDPYCVGMGELDPAKKKARLADGTLRRNPKTGNLEGYYETRAAYRQALRDQGCENSYGEGKIDPSKQGWDGKR